MQLNKGVFFVLLTALISGVSIYINSIAVLSFTQPILFTFLKNLIVAFFLISFILLFKNFSSIKILSKKNWMSLILIGLIGGSIPFALFFSALSLTSALNAAFIHKLLFLFVTVFAIIFLKEKFNKKVFLGAVLLVLSVILLFGLRISSFGLPDLMILAATLFWAAENTYSKKVLKTLSAETVAFGRMFFGSLFLLLFLSFTGSIFLLPALSLNDLFWVGVTSIFLFGYVFTFYNGLKLIPASLAASILLLGLPVTAVLNFFFAQKPILPLQLISYSLIFLGVFFMYFSKEKIFFLKKKFLVRIQ